MGQDGEERRRAYSTEWFPALLDAENEQSVGGDSAREGEVSFTVGIEETLEPQEGMPTRRLTHSLSASSLLNRIVSSLNPPYLSS